MLFAGLIIYAVLLTVAGILAVLKNSTLRDEKESAKFTARTLREKLSSVEDDLRRSQADLKEVITAWGEMGTKHARRRLRARLSSSLGQKYAYALNSLETPQRKHGQTPEQAVAEKTLREQLEDEEVEVEMRPIETPIPIMGKDVAL